MTYTVHISSYILILFQELELLPAKEYNDNIYIKHPIQLERVCYKLFNVCVKIMFT